MTALLLFVAGLGLGVLIGLTLAWAHWARVLEAERESHHQAVARFITRERDTRLDGWDASAARFAADLARHPDQPRPTRTRES